MTIKLKTAWAPFFNTEPETGMGYTICTVRLKDGRSFERVVIAGGYLTSVDGSSNIPFEEADIGEILVTHDKCKMLKN